MKAHLETLTDAELSAQAATELPYVTTSFEALVRRHQANLARFCRRILRDPDRAEDATQETLIRMYHGLADFQGRSDFKTWLFTIARNVCLTRIQRAAAESQARESYGCEQEGCFESDAETLDVDALLASMSVEDREILALRFIAGLSLQEIADTQDLTLSAAKMRLYRAIDQVRSRVLHSELER